MKKLFLLPFVVLSLYGDAGYNVQTTPYTRNVLRSVDGIALGSNLNQVTFVSTNNWTPSLIFKVDKPLGQANASIRFVLQDGRSWFFGVDEWGNFITEFNGGYGGGWKVWRINTNGVNSFDSSTPAPSFQSQLAQVSSPTELKILLQNWGAPPTFVAQPVDAEVFQYENFTLSVLVTNAVNVSYTWYHVPTNTVVTNAVCGTNSYTTNANDGTMGLYWCVANTAAGSVTSSIVMISYATLNNINANLANYWQFNETSGVRTDTVGANNFTEFYPVDGTPPGYGTGILGNSANFYSANQSYLQAATFGTSNNAAWSLNIWINTTLGMAENAFVLEDGDWGGGRSLDINCYNDGSSSTCNINYYDFPGDIETPHGIAGFSLTDGTWNMITVTSSGTEVKCYLNGSLYSTTSAGTSAPNNGVLTLGAWSAGGAISAFQSCDVDEMAKWNRVLSQADVTYLWNSGAGRLINQ